MGVLLQDVEAENERVLAVIGYNVRIGSCVACGVGIRVDSSLVA